jgi:hypothetical protein
VAHSGPRDLRRGTDGRGYRTRDVHEPGRVREEQDRDLVRCEARHRIVRAVREDVLLPVGSFANCARSSWMPFHSTLMCTGSRDVFATNIV